MDVGELRRRLRRIDVQTRRLAQNVLVGAYHAAFKGRGMVFDSVRPYQPGDDVRSIDWNVTARAGEPHVKQFVEERELTVVLAMDASGSMRFGTRGGDKREWAAEVGAVLAYSAALNHDRVSLLLFSDHNERYVPPRRGRNHVLRIIRDLMVAEGRSAGTDMAGALRHLRQALKRRAIVFVLSDFFGEAEQYQAELAQLARRHDVVALRLTDALERAWVDVGLVAVQDAESGAVRWADTASAQWREAFQAMAEAQRNSAESAFKRAGVEWLDLMTGEDYLPALQAFFKRRARR